MDSPSITLNQAALLLLSPRVDLQKWEEGRQALLVRLEKIKDEAARADEAFASADRELQSYLNTRPSEDAARAKAKTVLEAELQEEGALVFVSGSKALLSFISDRGPTHVVVDVRYLPISEETLIPVSVAPAAAPEPTPAPLENPPEELKDTLKALAAADPVTPEVAQVIKSLAQAEAVPEVVANALADIAEAPAQPAEVAADVAILAEKAAEPLDTAHEIVAVLPEDIQTSAAVLAATNPLPAPVVDAVEILAEADPVPPAVANALATLAAAEPVSPGVAETLAQAAQADLSGLLTQVPAPAPQEGPPTE